MDKRLEDLKKIPRAMRFYVLTLYESIREARPTNVLEIGTQYGISTRAILLGLKDTNAIDGVEPKGKLISLDHKSRENVLENGYDDLKEYWEFIKGDSHTEKSFDKVKNSIGESNLFDIMFIDGDHKYEGIKQDFEWYTKLLKPGGVLMMHDTVNHREGVQKLWDEIDWPEKFNCSWGLTSKHLIVGFGLARKPGALQS